MAELSTEELHAALFGTWTAVGRIAELLIRRAVLSEDELGSLLTAAEMTATDRQSRVGIAIVRDIMESVVRHDTRLRSASGDVSDQGVENGAEIRAGSAADWQTATAVDCRGMRSHRAQASAHPMVKGSDFDDAPLPGRRTEIVAEGADRRNVGDDPRPGPAPAPALPQRGADHFVGREPVSLLDTAV